MGRRVLVVEPSRTMRKLLEIYLQQDTHQVMLFAGYAEARLALSLPQVRTNLPEIAFVATNASWPDSYQFIDELQQRCHGTLMRTIIMLTREELTHPKVQRLLQGQQQIVPLVRPFRVQDMLALAAAPVALPPTC